MAVSKATLDQGLRVLESGGYLCRRLETDRYTGRRLNTHRLYDSTGRAVAGYGFAAYKALEPGLKRVSSRSSDWPTFLYLEPVAPRVKAAIAEVSRPGYDREWVDYS